MNKDFLPFAKPSIDQATIDEVTDCLQCGWITTGPRVKFFETRLKEYLHADHALALNSATSGLHLALQCLNLQPGDEVITTPMTFVATLNTIVHAGGKPVLVDVDINTYNIDCAKIETAITPKTRAIMPVHYAGVPVDLDVIYQIARKHNLHVIEDAAHAIGSYYKGKIIGSFGDTQVFSFHPNKLMTTAEGGCVTTGNAEIAKQIALMRFHGIDREAWNRDAKDGSPLYDVVYPGYKYNMPDILAAIGIHQLKHIEEFIAKRTLLAKRYIELFKDWSELTLPKMPDYDIRNSWYIFVPLINPEISGINRNDFIQEMKKRNIGIGLHYQSANLYTYYQQKFGYYQGQFPNSETIGDRIVSLPLFPDMTIADQDRVITAMADIFNK